VTQSRMAYITATSGLARGTITVTFRAGAPTRTTVHVEIDTLVVNTGASAAITVTLFDTYGNRVPGAPVTGYITPTTLGSLSLPSVTDEHGQAIGRWWAGTVPGSGVLVVNGTPITITLAPRLTFLPIVTTNFPPVPTGTWIRINSDAANTYQIAVTLEVSATVQGDYIQWMRFSNDLVNWGDWVTFAPTATWNLDPKNGLKTVYAQFAGHWGGVSAPISDDILLFMNGDFSQPNLANWNLDPNLLGVSSAFETYTSTLTSSAGLLGNPIYSCDNVPIGYGSISQNFIMPSVKPGQQLVLRFNYHIYTQDRNYQVSALYDRFDVLLNGARVFSDMNQDNNRPATCAVYYNLTRREAAIPVTGNPGSNINVAFRVYNLYDHKYNTYVYVDNVRLEFQGRSYDLSNKAPSLPETPDVHTGR